MLRILKNTDIKFMSLKKIPVVLSSILLVISLFSIIFKGFNFGIDFSSGYIVQLKFNQQVSVLDIQNKFSQNNIDDVSVQLYGSSKDILLKLKDDKLFQQKNINNYLNENSQILFSLFDINQIEYIDDRRYNLVLSNGRIVMLPKVIDSKLINFIKNNINLIDKSTNYQQFLDLRNFHNKTIRLK